MKKEPFNPTPGETDPLLRAVVEDEQGISIGAAAYARSRRQGHKTILQGSVVAAVLLGAGVAAILSLRGARQTSTHGNDTTVSSLDVTGKTPAQKRINKTAFVREYSIDNNNNDDGNEKLSAPAASEEARKLLREIEIDDEPTLIVWNDAGQVSRVHIFERRP